MAQRGKIICQLDGKGAPDGTVDAGVALCSAQNQSKGQCLCGYKEV